MLLYIETCECTLLLMMVTFILLCKNEVYEAHAGSLAFVYPFHVIQYYFGTLCVTAFSL